MLMDEGTVGYVVKFMSNQEIAQQTWWGTSPPSMQQTSSIGAFLLYISVYR